MTFNQRLTTLLQMNITPMNSDSLFKECLRIEEEYPDIPSEFRWTLAYKRFQLEITRGDKSAATVNLKAAIAMTPYNEDILGDYKQLVKKPSNISNIVLVISSKKNEAKALQLAGHLDRGNVEYLIVSGSDTGSIRHARALQVDASDHYESRPQKVAAAFAWVVENLGGNVGVLKVDDQIMLRDAGKLQRNLESLQRENAYAGLRETGVAYDRCLHWGKCEDPVLNRRVYGRPVKQPWAAGGAYYLGPGPLEKVVVALMRFPGLFDGEYYEDKLIGDILASEGVGLKSIGGYGDLGLELPGSAMEAKPVAEVSKSPVRSGPVLKITPLGNGKSK